MAAPVRWSRRVRVLALVLSLAAAGAACGGDEDEGDGQSLAGLVAESTTSSTTATTTKPTTTSTTEPHRVLSPTDVQGVMLTQADLPGFGPALPLGAGAGSVDYTTDPPECGDAWPQLPDPGEFVEISNYFQAVDTYSSVTQGVSVYPDLDLGPVLAEAREAAEGPCAEPFNTSDVGWAVGTLRYHDLSTPAVGSQAIAYVVDMDIVQEGVPVLATNHVLTFRRDPFLVTVQVVTGEAADGSFVGPPVTMDDVIAHAVLVDQRIVALLEG